ncbi:hypothetical protein ABVB18_20065 [Xanthomonas citri pv. mangiferaeindicae]|uniref:Uncharacterized protein n=1 Tax=Xanthomonas campestris pv. malvacearum TaxID=86040 RepID=A0AA44YZ12_XANCM|nr:hypothetical protein [Xanthomonas citri]ASN01396.1 hypothetical protein APY29_11395 [Xanthomonas citri pv. malvacearum]ASY84653.1 hypothetical protein CIW71_12190 [Xanthomonas citri pv. malvacearum]ASY84665.1 hypothetical protein CIW71_12280 [Xanthomonas citri pv. malvacearum]OOX01123.1 hypothetical protein Xmlv_20280 [Xanthomonas citri pv. malvacearum]PUE91025.1 hypothetical protein C7T86_19060 [Xanthomonas citri pv. malvacearum]
MSASVVSHIDTYHTVIGGRRTRRFRLTVRVAGRLVEQSEYASRRAALACEAAAVEFYSHG